MRSRRIAILLLFSITSLFLQNGIAQQNTVLPEYPNNYTIYEDLVQMPDGREMGSGNAIDVDLGIRTLWRKSRRMPRIECRPYSKVQS